ncbi:2Fe-2S iron-sulfur cluster binding domain-containing protein [Parasulfuritortus cantonensis]|uniref:2Fe-2S iron-sulfur cluster binding domain-containing protein n=1 Tax=Parasulfuritortus cantonensis TaxID=2528202 RepID=A0A4R1BD19_9PROT|nr:2Fe-2S iron-sulfur cluster-binding protein [Parasulfuritortus cantonensis]TCJ14914.1 2Fe-2S iron-sulfur cluster binding domain-containing protein [Parasulfuritortus cantonensis]
MPLITVNDGEAAFVCEPGDTLLRAGLRSGVGLPYECGVGACGCCRGEVGTGEVIDHWPAAPGLSDRDRRKGRILACQCSPVGDVQLRLRLDPAAVPAIPPRRRTATLVAVNDVTHDIREFVFRSEEAAAFLPGQFAFLSLPGVERERAYSMANLANDRGEWRFYIRRVPGGDATGRLFDTLKPGAEVGLDAPYGQAYLRAESPRDIVCIAGGSGLAPMLSVTRGYAARTARDGRRLDFFYGARTPADVCGQAELAMLPGYGEDLGFQVAVSDAEAAQAAGWTGRTSLVHELVEATLGDRLGQCEFYLAGPPGMIEALLQLLQTKHRIPPERIHFDRFF